MFPFAQKFLIKLNPHTKRTFCIGRRRPPARYSVTFNDEHLSVGGGNVTRTANLCGGKRDFAARLDLMNRFVFTDVDFCTIWHCSSVHAHVKTGVISVQGAPFDVMQRTCVGGFRRCDLPR